MAEADLLMTIQSKFYYLAVEYNRTNDYFNYTLKKSSRTDDYTRPIQGIITNQGKFILGSSNTKNYFIEPASGSDQSFSMGIMFATLG